MNKTQSKTFVMYFQLYNFLHFVSVTESVYVCELLKLIFNCIVQFRIEWCLLFCTKKKNKLTNRQYELKGEKKNIKNHLYLDIF